MDVMDQNQDQIEKTRYSLRGRGSPNAPRCGFLHTPLETLMSCGERFCFVDILSNPEIRANLPRYGNYWDTVNCG